MNATLRTAADLAPVSTIVTGSVRDHRRLLHRHPRRTGLDGYSAALEALKQCLPRAASPTRSPGQCQHDAEDHRHLPFMESYGQFLASVARISAILGTLQEGVLREQAKELRGLANEVQHHHRRVAEQAEQDNLPLEDPTKPFGVLLIDATRLVEELQHTSDVLQRYADH
ncbi:hypothetical protein [Streptomyces sp. NPDC051776]|uniref:hypothetical protein n=1 Tax=Streptomyces sp. NPDC051776 TaxID=3155414 RepID=UPI00341A24DF